MARRRRSNDDPAPPIEAGPGDTGLRAGTRALLVLVVVLPNLIGAGLVLLFAAFVLPRDVLASPGLLLLNIVVFSA